MHEILRASLDNKTAPRILNVANCAFSLKEIKMKTRILTFTQTLCALARRHAALLCTLFCALYPAYCEGIASAGMRYDMTWIKLLLALAEGFFIVAVGNVPRKASVRCAVQAGLCVVVSVLCTSQFIYSKIFGTPYYLRSAKGLSDAMQFGSIALTAVCNNILWVLALLAAPLALLTGWRMLYMEVKPRLHKAVFAHACGACALAAALCVSASGMMQELILYGFVPVNSARSFGYLPYMALDVKYNLLNISRDPIVVPAELLPSGADSLEEAVVSAEETSPQYAEHRLDLDFNISGAPDAVQSLSDWIETRPASSENEYTGLFEGKNLILITAESFSPYVIDEERTPTLYRLATEGFRFTNFYTPLWGVSTSDGEFVTTTSLIPKMGVWSYTEIADNYMPYALGSLFTDMGARSFAFHDHDYTYYNRQYSYPNMGYEYYGQGGRLDLTSQWPESDLEMMEATVPMFEGEDYFHVYYLTVSGHLNYSYLGNSMAAKNRDAVDDLEYSEPVRAYLACNMELEYALESLLEQLEEAGSLDDTVIALAADHYPYGLSNEEYAELRGVDELDEEFELYRNAFLLWTPGIEPVEIDTACSNLDILPTLLNLFGIEYDSRLLMGTDVFGGIPPIVMFYDHSFITEKAFYNAMTGEVTPRTDEAVSADYITMMRAVVNERFTYSARIIESDYYRWLFEGTGAGEAVG